MKAAVVVGAGQGQQLLISHLRKQGHEVITVGRGGQIDVDISDWRQIVQKMRTGGIEPEMIVSDQSDPCILAANILARFYNLPSNLPGSMEWYSCCGKDGMYERADEINIPTPETKEANNPEDLDWPDAIIKPSEGWDSRGLYDLSLLTPEMKAACLDDSKQYGPVLVQQKVPGKWVLVDALYAYGDFRILATADCTTSSFGVLDTATFPSELDLTRAKEYLERYVRASGLNFGIIHSEWMIRPDGEAVLIEVACRGGGFDISGGIDSWVSGTDVYEAMYPIWAGKSNTLTPLTDIGQNCHAVLKCHRHGDGYDEVAVRQELRGHDYLAKLTFCQQRNRNAYSVYFYRSNMPKDTVQKVDEVLSKHCKY